MKYIVIVTLAVLSGVLFAEPDLYFADSQGNRISSIAAAPGTVITVYIFGQTDPGHTYDSFNLSLSFDPTMVTPKNASPNMDLVLSTDSTFGPSFGSQLLTYGDSTLLNASVTSFTGPPSNFNETLLATAYFTVQDIETQISFFNEPDDITYSTYFMDTFDLSVSRFDGTLAIVPEPLTVGLMSMGFAGLVGFLKK